MSNNTDFFAQLLGEKAKDLDAEEKSITTEAPEEEEFSPSLGTIGIFRSRPAWRAFSSDAYAEGFDEWGVEPDEYTITPNGMCIMVWFDGEKAKGDCKVMSLHLGLAGRDRIRADHILMAVADAGDIWTELPEFVQTQGKQEYTVEMASTSRIWNRHRYHLLYLPAMVQAVALKQGIIEAPIFDYRSLPSDADSMDEAAQARVLACCYYTEIKGENGIVSREYSLDYRRGKPQPITEAELWGVREILWKAIGEDDGEAYLIDDAKSDTLKAALMMLHGNIPYRAQYAAIIDMRKGGIRGNGKPNFFNIPVQIFLTDEEASEAAQGGERSEATGEPAYPVQWAKNDMLKGQWMEMVKEIHESGEAPTEESIADLMATMDNYNAWVEHLGLEG